MALYTVLGECIVDGRHYPRPHPDPVEMADDAAAQVLVHSGVLAVIDSGKPGRRHKDQD